jgi:hypothetical protein
MGIIMEDIIWGVIFLAGAIFALVRYFYLYYKRDREE